MNRPATASLPPDSNRDPRLSRRLRAIFIGLSFLALVWIWPSRGSLLWLPFGLLIGVLLHTGVGLALKAVWASASPLSSHAPEVASYERRVYGIPDRRSWELVGLALSSGLCFGLAGALPNAWLMVPGVLIGAWTLVLDLRRWERVTVSAEDVWFQRGLGQKVHQVPIDNIVDIAVKEQDDRGISLRHLTRNRLCRITLKLADKRLLALPKTDAWMALDAVESVANHVRTRKHMLDEVTARRRGAEPPSSPQPDDRSLRRELKRLRLLAARSERAATPSPDVPPSA